MHSYKKRYIADKKEVLVKYCRENDLTTYYNIVLQKNPEYEFFVLRIIPTNQLYNDLFANHIVDKILLFVKDGKNKFFDDQVNVYINNYAQIIKNAHVIAFNTTITVDNVNVPSRPTYESQYIINRILKKCMKKLIYGEPNATFYVAK